MPDGTIRGWVRRINTSTPPMVRFVAFLVGLAFGGAIGAALNADTLGPFLLGGGVIAQVPAVAWYAYGSLRIDRAHSASRGEERDRRG